MESIRYKKPRISSDYINIYRPAEDIYRGPNSLCFKKDMKYSEWITNDFTIINGLDNRWHIIGITHPKPDGFINSYIYNQNNVHDAEWQLFHAVSEKNMLKDCIYRESFIDKEKLLYPQVRPNEEIECWAPCLVLRDNRYYLFYSPHSMRLATSYDLYKWDIEKAVFQGKRMTRDPYIFFENDTYYMIYVEDNLYMRMSSDLYNWSEPKLFQKSPFKNAAQESPCLFKKDGVYYLMWCIYDGLNGCYDNRTFVFASKSINGFDGISPITMLEGHASEIIRDLDGQYYILSIFFPDNGVNIAHIEWI